MTAQADENGTEQPTGATQGDEQPEPAPEGTESADGAQESGAAAREAAKYRRQLRETQTSLDAATARVEAMQRAEVERIAGADLATPGDLWLTGPDLADLLDDVGRGSVTRVGDLAGALHAAAEASGGRLSAADLDAYAVRERAPLRASYRGAELVTNPPPSFGGSLVVAALGELERHPPQDGSAFSTARLAEALVRMSERHVAGPTAVRGTTHVSVVDADGGLAALTMSNGSCSGVFAPGTGIQLNNVMGEADLHPHGLEATAAGVRIGSMMAPTVVRTPDGTRTALGSGGSERIRSALLCTIVGLVDRGESLGDAVAAPRLHWDRSVLQVEPGLPADVLDALRELRPVSEWAARDLYFGGVHAVAHRPDGSVDAVGDARRSGATEVVRLH